MDLIAYLSERYYGQKKEPTGTGPYITLSRETGCNATGLAAALVKTFRKNGQHWHFVNKEILDKSAEKLHLDRRRLEHEFLLSKSSIMDDVIKAMSLRYFKNDKKIRDTISEIIRYEAQKGHAIIVGRAGVVSTQGIPNGLNIRLVAPLSWRIRSLAKRKLLSEKEAREYIEEMDRKRNFFLEQFSGKPVSEIYFDLTINLATFSEQEVIRIIMNTLEIKGIL
ncbi:cytidylate kinase-like family protein [Candidatus Sulfidibacterium hydrothermale]|uniref:cytidylate kinase-like family protein n=1 Tax=Candidatus Sulfidibacterium hydrothermale TaxID=2875962 RepID=UPI001F0AE66D|nr:cytidylate kinase-like family protein [Candidatus Sulfidibacterium hydrothermale]UBM62141.1 cytidylate kinase-like family protein [Candidatus Sulfidibacterium hydrothermale]